MSDPVFPIEKGKPRPKKAKAKKGPTKTQLLKRCDAAFSKIIRSRGRCENCGTSDSLQCAHGFSRSYRATRFDARQCWALCASCHVFYTHRPLQWEDWMRARMGDALYEEVRVLALTGSNPDLAELLPVLTAELNRIERRAA